MNKTTKEPQYVAFLKHDECYGREPLGLSTNYAWNMDPKRLGFTWARYKWVARMLAGRRSVLEIGCGDAFFTRVVQQEVGELVAIDFDPVFVDDVNKRMTDRWSFACLRHDMLDPLPPSSARFDGVFALDVLEHIRPEDERKFLSNAVLAMREGGAAIFGVPSLASQEHASELSRLGHVNCKDGPGLRTALETHFHSVFLFSMNDETVHTGYEKMAHYYLALCADARS